MAEAPGSAPESKMERRIALVVGNANYLSGRPLINTDADAIGVADALKLLGFVSHIRGESGEDLPLEAMHDQKLMEMKRALADFSVASRDADMSVIYYSGHGIEINFRNFLIPIDATLKHSARLDYEAVPLAEVISATGGARKLRLVILDACRDNPLVSSMVDFDPGKSGTSIRIGKPSPTASALTFYAATEGQTAKQGTPGGRSPFADSLITRMLEPEEINRVFGLVTADVKKKTNETQEPCLYGPPLAQAVYLVPTEIKEPGFDRPFPIPPPRRRDDQKTISRPRSFIAAVSLSLIAAVAVIWTFPEFARTLIHQPIQSTTKAPAVPEVAQAAPTKISPDFHVPTPNIVHRIRCETRLAIQDKAIAVLAERSVTTRDFTNSTRDLIKGLVGQRGLLWNFDWGIFKDRAFFDRFLRASIAYDFSFNITENAASGSPDLLANDHSRHSLFSETFQDLLADRHLVCNNDALFGRIGIDELISAFIDSMMMLPASQAFADKFSFTTPVTSAPSAMVSIAKSSLGAASQRNTSESQLDKHAVIIGLSLDAQTTAVPGGAVGDPGNTQLRLGPRRRP
jgi:hypothetical protein